ncbi:MAG: GtrA family protein [Coriobacteriia bacterium]|nr:GtrA family protein [Coriobacteriia bacterium]
MVVRAFIDKLFNGTHGEKLRFFVAGCFNAAVAYGLFALGLWLLAPPFAVLADAYSQIFAWFGTRFYLIVQWLVWVISVPIGAFTMKYFAFRVEGSYIRQTIRAYGVYFPTQMLTFGLLFSFTVLLGFRPLLGQFLSLVIAGIFSYLGHKYFTFKQV